MLTRLVPMVITAFLLLVACAENDGASGGVAELTARVMTFRFDSYRRRFRPTLRELWWF